MCNYYSQEEEKKTHKIYSSAMKTKNRAEETKMKMNPSY